MRAAETQNKDANKTLKMDQIVNFDTTGLTLSVSEALALILAIFSLDKNISNSSDFRTQHSVETERIRHIHNDYARIDLSASYVTIMNGWTWISSFRALENEG